MSETEMKKLFSLFGKLDEKNLTENPVNSEGIGMGLFICKQIVENLGGTIECHSAGEGKGSTFMFSMKIEAARECLRVRNDSTVAEESVIRLDP